MLLDHLGVPYRDAPGEAEAECVRMQQNNIVDAVWSQDSDMLVLSATLLFTPHIMDKSTEKDTVKVYGSEVIRGKYGLDREGLVLFMVMAGGDYTKGLPKFGIGKFFLSHKIFHCGNHCVRSTRKA